MKHLTTLLAALAFPAAAAAQSDIVPSKPQSRPIAIINAVIHTAGVETPVIENGHILFDGGRIMSVGPGAPALPEGCEVVDAKGMHASPGFVALPSSLGLVETLQVDVTDDRTEIGDLRPEVTPAVAINPDSDLLTVSRAAGILISISVPDGGLVSGNASALRLDGWTPEELTIDPSVGLVMTWPMVEPARSFVSRRSPEEQKRRRTSRASRGSSTRCRRSSPRARPTRRSRTTSAPRRCAMSSAPRTRSSSRSEAPRRSRAPSRGSRRAACAA
jgi:PAS domain-containing protein